MKLYNEMDGVEYYVHKRAAGIHASKSGTGVQHGWSHRRHTSRNDGGTRYDTFLRETDREKVYPTQYFYDWHHRLTGSCDMGRKQFARDHGVDLDHGMMTLTEFLELTKDAYGGDVIRKVISKMQEVK